ncbi:MAG: hypothetical protein OQL06_11420 [Gammaproteobacteria bacterium]|nr:hypothetical protein [Gammaproteobacteria bacterium]
MTNTVQRNNTALEKLLELYRDVPVICSLQSQLMALDASVGVSQIDDYLRLYDEAIPPLENQLLSAELDEERLQLFQQLFQQMESLIAEKKQDRRYEFVIIIPVADRPQHLAACLNSLLDLCNIFNYGGYGDQGFNKISVLIADDSKHKNNIVKNRKIAETFSAQGLRCFYFGQQQQKQQINKLSDNERKQLISIIGDIDPDAFYHKGASIMRNISYLKLNELARANDRLLFYFIDSDQEFRVKIDAEAGERDSYAINYFYHLDRIFTDKKISILTGKVVGDPPVSPSVMAGNFLEDVIAFLTRMSKLKSAQACQFHAKDLDKGSDAAYHDMASLFGFDHTRAIYDYRCTLQNEHDHAACFRDFASKLKHFFDGEHPTRKTCYEHEDLDASIKPARTIYTGNYVFRPEQLACYIPFATLKLRMAGPVLGRLIKSDIGAEFVSANLPMLHKRTVDDIGQSEFRPGINRIVDRVDLAGEFERQFFGDVMLFTIVHLTDRGYPGKSKSEEQIESALQETEEQLRQRYRQTHKQIIDKLNKLKDLFNDQTCWWHNISELSEAREAFIGFIDNMETNFGQHAKGYQLIENASHVAKRHADILDAIVNYSQDKAAWQKILKDALLNA